MCCNFRHIIHIRICKSFRGHQDLDCFVFPCCKPLGGCYYSILPGTCQGLVRLRFVYQNDMPDQSWSYNVYISHKQPQSQLPALHAVSMMNGQISLSRLTSVNLKHETSSFREAQATIMSNRQSHPGPPSHPTGSHIPTHNQKLVCGDAVISRSYQSQMKTNVS